RHTDIIPRHNNERAKSKPITLVLQQEPGSHLEPYDKKGEISCKSHVASYLARKTSDLGKSKKNLPLAPNEVKNKLTTYTLNKTSRTSNNQLHVNNNMILEKAIEPNIVTNNIAPQSKNETILSPIQKGNNNTLKKKKEKLPLERKPKQEFLKENIKQNESAEKWVDKQYNPRKCKRFITHLLPESFPKQVKKLRELVKENENRVKLIGVTTDAHWDEI
ncbi:21554_t:CDS:2, partial [Dentiscutata erythropus]